LCVSTTPPRVLPAATTAAPSPVMTDAVVTSNCPPPTCPDSGASRPSLSEEYGQSNTQVERSRTSAAWPVTDAATHGDSVTAAGVSAGLRCGGRAHAVAVPGLATCLGYDSTRVFLVPGQHSTVEFSQFRPAVGARDEQVAAGRGDRQTQQGEAGR